MSAFDKAALAWALARLAEPSTWSGLAALIASMAFLPHAATAAEIVAAFGVFACGVLAAVRKERGSPK